MGDFGLQRFYTWFQAEALVAVYIILIFFLLAMLARRAYIPALMGVLAISFVVIFIQAPEKVKELASMFGQLFGI